MGRGPVLLGPYSVALLFENSSVSHVLEPDPSMTPAPNLPWIKPKGTRSPFKEEPEAPSRKNQKPLQGGTRSPFKEEPEAPSRRLYPRELGAYLESQGAQNNGPQYPKVAHNLLKITHL